MKLTESDRRQLKAWLVDKLADISSAEPSVLADYTVALLTNGTPKSDLRAKCVEHLSDFLGDETNSFVEMLLLALDDGSYRERDHDRQRSSRKDEGDEGYDSNDDRDTHHRRRGRSSENNDRRTRRNSRSRSREQARGRERYAERNDRGGRRRDDTREGPRRRDQRNAMHQPPQHQQQHQSQRQYPHRGRTEGNQRGMPPGFDPRMPPEAFMFPPPDMMLPPGMMPPPPGYGMPPMMMGPGFGMAPPGMEGMMGMGGQRDNKRRKAQSAGMDTEADSPVPMGAKNMNKHTVRCRGIPQDITAGQIARHFSQFGKIVTTQLGQGEERGGKFYLDALVQFVTPESARKSVSSPLPVLNNRFIKVMLADHNVMDPSTVDESMIEPNLGSSGEPTGDAEDRHGDDSQRKTGPSFAQTRTLKQYEQLKQLRQRQDDISKQKQQLIQAQIDQYQAIVDEVTKAKPNLSDDAPELQEYTSKLHELREQLARVKEGGEELQEEPYYPVRGSRGRGRGGRALAGGRGRGRSSRGRGRGRAALTGQSIDNRPKTIVITSPPESFGPELAKSHFERFGEVEGVTKQDDQLLVRFTTRRSGDTALKSGTFYQGGHLNAGWHQGEHVLAGDSQNGSTQHHDVAPSVQEDNIPDTSDNDNRKQSRYQGVLADVLGGPDELDDFDDV